jgi:uncharacterized protein
MSRVLFWTLLLILVVAAVRSKLRGGGFLGGSHPAPDLGQRPARGGEVETMTCCAHCHVYFPASEAVHAGGQDYCSPAHAGLPPA